MAKAKRKPAPLNLYQRAAKAVYGGGDYRHHKTMAETQGANVDDGLYSFIMRELADDGGMDKETATQYMRAAISDIEIVLAALNRLPLPPLKATDKVTQYNRFGARLGEITVKSAASMMMLPEYEVLTFLHRDGYCLHDTPEVIEVRDERKP